jgi:hypothetical protein
MPEHDARAAARDRDSGLRKISRLTWRAGAAGAVFSAVIGIALTHHGEAAASTHAQPGSTQAPARQQQPGSIQIPAQPPQSSSGGGQVTSGAS